MRTTLTLEPDVAAALNAEVHRRRATLKEVVNDALRRGLMPAHARKEGRPYRLPSHDARLLPGIDPGSLNRLADELEADATLRKARPR